MLLCISFQISKDSVFIRRNPEMPIPENTEERRNDFNDRSAYVVSILSMTLLRQF